MLADLFEGARLAAVEPEAELQDLALTLVARLHRRADRGLAEEVSEALLLLLEQGTGEGDRRLSDGRTEAAAEKSGRAGERQAHARAARRILDSNSL